MRFRLLQGISPGMKLLVFCGLLMMMAGLGAAILLLVGVVVYQIPIDSFEQWMMNYANPEVVEALKWMNDISQVFTFLLPPLLFVFLVGRRSVNGFMLHNPGPLIFLVPFWLLASNAIIDMSSSLNEWLIPVDSSLGSWFKKMEDSAEGLTKAMLESTGTTGLILSIITVAIIPAICEEWAFRGTLQPLLAKVTRSHHLAVWITAGIFAFIHFQFYGMLPRMILGAMLGYLVLWTGSLWTSIIAHMFNNTLAFVLYRYYGNSMEAPSDDWTVQWPFYAISFGFFMLMTGILLKYSKWPLFAEEYLTDPDARR